MGTKLVHRPARLLNDTLPADPLKLSKAPSIDATASSGMAMRALVPIIGGLGMMAMMMSSGSPIRMMAGGAMVAAAVIGGIALFVHAKTGGRRKAEQHRTHYVEFIGDVRGDLERESADQRRAGLRRHPDPPALLDTIRDPSRLWERRPSDPDFLSVRIGTGVGPLARGVDVTTESDPLKRAEPIAKAHLDRLVTTTERIDGLPMAVPLSGVVSFVGPTLYTHEAVRGALTQLAALHAPDDVRLHLCLPRHGSTDVYEWALWLPHLLDPDHFDGPLGRRQTSRNIDDLALLGDEITRRRDELGERAKRYGKDKHVDGHHIVVVIDNDDPHGREALSALPIGGDLVPLRMTVVVLNEKREMEPGHVDARVIIGDDRVAEVTVVRESEPEQRSEDKALERQRRLVRGAVRGSIDSVPTTLARAIARRLAPIRLVQDATPDAPLETTITLESLLGVQDMGSFDIHEMWAPRSLDNFLNVPFAVSSTGQPVNLNIKESAQEGMGPHGLCVGATGSGKSEVLRTLVLSQAICHSPERLALVLVDYKGGAAFSGLDKLPHTTAMVDNLSDDSGLVDRLHDALLGEMQRRQQVLQAAGSLPNVTEYNRRRDAGQDLDPLPNLLVVIDEFGEILTAKPDFIDLFVQIGRIGRSIGVHLLLATQRLEEGRLRGLESHLSYRIGLRTFSAQESRTAIGSPDAHELPSIPGSGILKVDPDVFQRFKAAYVSGRYVPPADAEDSTLPPIPMPFSLNNETGAWLQDQQVRHRLATTGKPTDDRDDDPFSESTLDMVARRLGNHADKVHQIWLPPLPKHLQFEHILGPLERTRHRGLGIRDRSRAGSLRIPLGLKDRPLRQWQGPLELDLSASGGHAAILGSPQSGKTTALRALVIGAALTHTPTEVSFYLIDMAGSSLASLARLPHVGDVATRFDSDKIRRTIAEIDTHLAMRERVFADHGLETVDQMRELHRRGGLPEIANADILLVIDGYSTFREEYEDSAVNVQDIASRGLGYGIHVVFATGRWADFRIQMQATIGTKLELRLNDPLDSTIGRRLVETIRADTPGRCVDSEKLMAQVCEPAYGVDIATMDATMDAIATAWTGPAAAPVRMLPERVELTAIQREHPTFPTVVAGIAESDLMPVRIDLLGAEPHIVLFGDSGSGKTGFARTIIEDMCPHFREGQLVFAVFDPKRQLMDAVPPQFAGGYAGTTNVASSLVQSIVQEMQRRMPPDDVTTQQLRDRSWWTGPEVVLIVDDYDLMEGNSSPLRPLTPYLPQARDLGLHVVLMRRSGGAGRAQYEHTVQALKESGATGILLSGDRQEGQMWPKVYMSTQPPGRAQIVRRGGLAQRMQLAYTPTEHERATGDRA